MQRDVARNASSESEFGVTIGGNNASWIYKEIVKIRSPVKLKTMILLEFIFNLTLLASL